MTNRSCLIGIIALLVCNSCDFAVSQENIWQAIGDVVDGGPTSENNKWRPYVDAQGQAGSSREVAQGNLFLPIWQDGDSLLFADLRGQWTDVQSAEGNWGLAFRQKLENQWIIGAYAFYDLRHTRRNNNFQQATIGVELLNVDWGFRFNGYIPDDDSEPVAGLNAAVLRGSNIFVRQGQERPYHGLDFEAEYLLWGNNQDFYGPSFAERLPFDMQLWASLGAFHFDNSAQGFQHITGGRARTELRFFDLPLLGDDSRLVLSGQFEYDNLRHSSSSGILTVRIPFGPGGGRKSTRLSALDRRMVAPIVRDIDIVTNAAAGPLELAKFARTGNLISNVVTIDGNTANPEAAIAAAGINSVAIASGEEGTIFPNGTINLNRGQVLIGGGAGLSIIGCETGTRIDFRAPGSRPTFLNTDNAVSTILLADHSAVIGVNLDGGLDGITGDGIRGRIDILNTRISNVQDDGIGILVDGNKTLIGEIRGNTIRNTDLAATATGEGIELTTTGNANVNLMIAGNRFARMGSDAVLIDANDQSSVTLQYKNNTTNEAEDDGFEISGSENARIEAHLDSNQWVAVNDDAIEVNVRDASRAALTIIGNEILGQDITNDGIDLDLDGTSQVTAHIEDNRIIDVTDIGIEADVNDSATLDLSQSIVGNVIMGADDDGINIELDTGANGSAVVSIRNNLIQDISDDGVFIDVNDAGTAEVTLSGNQFIRTGMSGAGDAIEISVSDHNTGDISLTTTISNNTITDSPTGIRIGTSDNESDGEYLVNMTTTIVGNTFLRNGTGVALQYSSDSDADDGQFVSTTTIRNNTFQDGTGDGINLDVSDWDDEDLTISVNVEGNQFLTHAGDAIDLNVSDIDLDTGVVNFLPSISNNIFTGTAQDNIRIRVADEASLIGNIRNNTISGGGDGIDIFSGGVGPNNVIIGGNAINNVTGTGVLFDSAAATNILDVGRNNTVNNAGTNSLFNNAGNLGGSQILINGVRRP